MNGKHVVSLPESHGYLNRIYFPHEKCVSERICTKIIFIKRVATPEGPKSGNRNQLELKTASLYGIETDGSPWKLPLAVMHST